MMVSANPVADPLLVKYDLDDDGKINLDEALGAVAEYFAITRSGATEQAKQDAEREVLDVVARFFSDSRGS
jgi:hypothetical protein